MYSSIALKASWRRIQRLTDVDILRIRHTYLDARQRVICWHCMCYVVVAARGIAGSLPHLRSTYGITLLAHFGNWQGC